MLITGGLLRPGAFGDSGMVGDGVVEGGFRVVFRVFRVISQRSGRRIARGSGRVCVCMPPGGCSDSVAIRVVLVEWLWVGCGVGLVEGVVFGSRT